MITTLTATPIGPDIYRLDFASDLPSPTFSIYSSGQLLYTTSLTSALVYAPPGEAPVFEVLDDDSDASDLTAGFPSTVTLAWYAVAGSASYRIDQQSGASWIQRRTINDDGRGYFTWQSASQPDGQVATFRVVPTGSNGNEGTAVTFAVLVVRNPDPPAVTIAYSSATSTVTITGS